jgi:hypothetical protein
MTLTTLLPALDIAAFERRPNGSFSPMAPPPPWFVRIVADGTLPFLGHILEEANQFWESRSSGRRDWGPCAEVDATGSEFHYMVTAVTIGYQQYLCFQLDPGSDRLREVLQQVRDQALAANHGVRDEAAVENLTKAQKDVQQAADELDLIVRRLLGADPADARIEPWKTVSAKCEEIVRGVDKLTRAAIPQTRHVPPQP